MVETAPVWKELSLSLEMALAEMAAFTDAVIGPKTPGWKAKFQIRCDNCGRFAKVLRSGDGHYHTPSGHEYDPWWEVDCKRCGVGEGFAYIPE